MVGLVSAVKGIIEDLKGSIQLVLSRSDDWKEFLGDPNTNSIAFIVGDEKLLKFSIS